MRSLQLLHSPKHMPDNYSQPASSSLDNHQFLDEKSDLLNDDLIAMAEASTSLFNQLTNGNDISMLNFNENEELNRDVNFLKIQKNFAKCFDNNNCNFDFLKDNQNTFQLTQNNQKFQSLGQNIQSQQHAFSGRHAMWGYFDVSRQHTGYYYCKADSDCNSAYTWPPSTTVAGRHMRDRHPDVYVKIMEEEAVRKMSTDSQIIQQQQRTSSNVLICNNRKRPASSNSNCSQTITPNLSLLSNNSMQNTPKNSAHNNKLFNLSDSSVIFDSRSVKSVKLEDIISCISTNHENFNSSNLSESKQNNFSPLIANKRKASAVFLNNIRSNLLKGFFLLNF